MLKLSQVIKKGLQEKQAQNKGNPEKIPAPETASPPTKKIEPHAQNSLPEVPVHTSPQVKTTDEETSPISLINKEIESLELTTDEEEKLYKVGDLATLSFKDLEGYNPVMATAKVKEAVKESLLKRYDVKPEELEKELEGFKKKFRAFGTHCYIRALKEKI
ncbi:MAG: hypothetical protein GXO98_01555 [Nitrospirae bacterium]|nr:hypothetical protein [Nitrospirota bacterium]